MSVVDSDIMYVMIHVLRIWWMNVCVDECDIAHPLKSVSCCRLSKSTSL